MLTSKRWRLLGAAAVAAAALWGLAHLKAQDSSKQIARGKYLAESVAACGHCHTPRERAEPDMTRHLSGHPASAPAPKSAAVDLIINEGVFISISPTMTAFSGPWGVSFATNLTPDKETGLGAWTEEQFIRAMRSGKHKGDPEGRAILPPMPWKHYQSMSQQDMKDMWAYFQSLKPIRNAVPKARNQLGNPLD
ncbi:MAG: c-type cytochrome [Candidatus Poribacteria bacterium]|nr:c-type cytochrome [Candidatus Poribacteria bacterium]